MKKTIIIFLALLCLTSLLGGVYTATITNAASATVSAPQDATLGYSLPDVIPLTEGTVSTVTSFWLYNRFPLNAIVNVQGTIVPINGVTVTPDYELVPADSVTGFPIKLSYNGMKAGQYIVTFQVTADVGGPGTGAHVVLTFNVPVTVTPASPG